LAASLDHLVGEVLEMQWYVKAKRTFNQQRASTVPMARQKPLTPIGQPPRFERT
jgi:hypothetical protein